VAQVVTVQEDRVAERERKRPLATIVAGAMVAQSATARTFQNAHIVMRPRLYYSRATAIAGYRPLLALPVEQWANRPTDVQSTDALDVVESPSTATLNRVPRTWQLLTLTKGFYLLVNRERPCLQHRQAKILPRQRCPVTSLQSVARMQERRVGFGGKKIKI
jgi:hypothetical protein